MARVVARAVAVMEMVMGVGMEEGAMAVVKEGEMVVAMEEAD